jgi:hypothetical protein
MDMCCFGLRNSRKKSQFGGGKTFVPIGLYDHTFRYVEFGSHRRLAEEALARGGLYMILLRNRRRAIQEKG